MCKYLSYAYTTILYILTCAIFCLTCIILYLTPYTQPTYITLYTSYSKQPEDVQELVIKFCEYSTHIKDRTAVRYLTSCIAKLTQETLHMSILKNNNLLQPLLKLLTDLVQKSKVDLAIQECVCISICHIALSLKKLPG